ncbi:Aspartyl/glutamyl-tRNA(Asn/Gln) amidotransferase subunit C [Gammaproteobacteria bacterium]
MAESVTLHSLAEEDRMSLQRADVERIAHLARLAIAEEDIPRYARELSGILDFVRQMEVVDTAGVVPMAHPLDAIQRLRPDQVAESDQRALFQSIAPLAEDGLYLVPKVIE